MNNKKEYSNSLVYMVIFILALPIVLPPYFRIMFPPTTEEVEEETGRIYLMCSKPADDGMYSASSTIVYENKVPLKNTINFFYAGSSSSVEERVDGNMSPTIQYNEEDYYEEDEYVEEEEDYYEEDEYVEEEEDETEEGDAGFRPSRTIAEEIDFFRTIEGINFQQNESSISLVVNQDSLSLNPNNLELVNYLLDIAAQQDFYIRLGYDCYAESE